MSYPENDDLKRACAALRIRDVWHAAHRDGILTLPAPQRDGLTESPFREDGKKGSFSICHDGHGYKDFGGAGISGDAWKFHALCYPAMTKGERAKAVIELAVSLSLIVETPRPPAAASTSAPGTAAPVDPAIAKAAKAIERRAKERAAEEAIYDARSAALRAPSPKMLPACPKFVAERYEEGIAHMRADPARVRDLARERGWPEAWAWELVELGLVSYPWERWARPGEKWAARQKAFLVQRPRPAGMGRIELATVGYHQRFYQPANHGRPENKGWLYAPSVPKFAPRGEYEEKLLAYGIEVGATDKDWQAKRPGEARPVKPIVPPLPFVLGDLHAPELIVLLEGQWDAATFFGACGYFHDTTPAEGIAVFGIRGVQGMDAFLSYYGAWLEHVAPRAWLIGDNDAAGGTWRDAPPAEVGMPRPPSLADRLVAHGCRSPLISWLRPGTYGKDFNDYFKAAKPTPLLMREWMRKTGIVDASGRWL